MSTRNSDRVKFVFPRVNEEEDEQDVEKEKEAGQVKLDRWLQDFVNKLKAEKEEKLVKLSEDYESKIKALESKMSQDSGKKDNLINISFY